MRIGIVAHESRLTRATKLFHEIRADHLFTDNGDLGCEGNHRRAWANLSSNAFDDEWLVVIEDDAKPCNDFREQLADALDHCPTDIASLYLGRKRPPQWQDFIQQAAWRADDENACWITSDAALHAVGIAMRGPELVESMLNRTSKMMRPIDERITMWCRLFGHPVAYAWPSLLDHDDDLPTTHEHRDGAPRDRGRVAWSVGTRDRWTSRSVALKQ